MAAPKEPKVEGVNPLDIIEMAATFADLAATFRDALVAQDFHSAPAEQTALQIAGAIFTANVKQ